MTKTFDPTKPVQLRDGRAARILATDLKSHYGTRIVAALTAPTTGNEHVLTFYTNGRFMSTTADSDSDLVNVPETVVLYASVYNQGLGGSHRSLAVVKGSTLTNSLGIVKISMEKDNINSLKMEVME